jgi:hypothetical protein
MWQEKQKIQKRRKLRINKLLVTKRLSGQPHLHRKQVNLYTNQHLGAAQRDVLNQNIAPCSMNRKSH